MQLMLALGLTTTRALIRGLRITLLASLPLAGVLAAELPYKLGDFKTVDGHEYHGVVVTEKTATGITIKHASGAGRFAWSEVPAETQRLLGYDPAAEAAAAQKAAAELAQAQARVNAAAARLSPPQLKSLLSKFAVSPINNKAWRLAFVDPSTVTISFSYTTPALWYPIGGIAATREDQLRDVLASKLIQNRGGRGFTDEEVQFLSFETRVGLERHAGRQQTFRLTFPVTHVAAISQQIARYSSALAQASAESYDFGAVGPNTFGYNKDKTMRVNDTSLLSSEVSTLDALVARIPQLHEQICEALLQQ
jgi:hypothetical protein